MRARRLGPAVLAILFAVVAAPASAASTIFEYTGTEQTFVVPAEVRSIHVMAAGGEGATGTPFWAEGGRGASVTTDIAVTPGETFYVEVGGAGLRGGLPAFGGGGAGGADTLGGQPGGGGGGASDIRRLPRSAPGSASTRLVVAAGGGGSGGGPYGGLGGSGDDDGGGCAICISAQGDGGVAGTASAGGLGGDPYPGAGAPGDDGQLDGGGAGGTRGGGGGGGGYYGGGGGGGGDTTAQDGGGGGGGGGSSFVAGGGAARFGTSGPGPGVVTFSYGEAKADVTPSTVYFAAQRIPTVGEQTITVTNRGTIPLVITGATITGANDFQAGPGCAAPVAPGASCQMVVRFAPRASGYRNARLTIVSNARPSSTVLRGLGLRPLKPTLTALRISPSTFKPGRKVVVSYRADVAGTATFRVLRVKTSKGRTRFIPVGASFTRAAHAGANRFRFTGRKLPPGRYRLRGYGSGPSRSISAAFRIARA
jgi:Glycine rich protein